MGAWIETMYAALGPAGLVVSLPIWERGLKHSAIASTLSAVWVAPYMGAWIETKT